MIAIEGCDAAGKATQAKLLAAHLGGEVISFPDYSTPTGEVIREFLSSARDQDIRALVLQSLMMTNRLECLAKINALCAAGKSIVFDRYCASALVYGGLDGLDRAWLESIQTVMPEPDIYVLIDVSEEESIRRRPERRDEYELRAGFMSKVRVSYLRLFGEKSISERHDTTKWRVVDGLGTIEEVQGRIRKAIEENTTMIDKYSLEGRIRWCFDLAEEMCGANNIEDMDEDRELVRRTACEVLERFGFQKGDEP
jgi:dTMP kinase